MEIQSSKAQLFLDCDGVLADFARGAEAVFGMSSREAKEKLGDEVFWRTLRHQPNFYGGLPLLPDACALFEAVRHQDPIILTGCPVGGWAEQQKLGWGAMHFPGVRMITCLAREKRLYARPGDVLVDDYSKFRTLWEQAGGIFVHHTSLAHTLRTLHAMSMLRG